MLDIQLQVFKTVVEQKSFSKAAEVLHMTQSSVSQQIQYLEEFYGVKLFDRLHRRIVITAAGEALYPYAVELERLYFRAQKTMQSLVGEISGKLHTGASLTIGEYVLPALLVAFRKLYPKVEIEMEVCNSEQVVSKLIEGSIDIGFVEGVFEPSPILIAKSCGGDRLAVIASNDIRPEMKTASLAELLTEKWVMREHSSGTRKVFEQFIASKGYVPTALNLVMVLGSTQAIKEAVSAGIGMSVISGLALADIQKNYKLRIIKLKEGEIKREFRLLFRRDKFQTRAVEEFVSFVGRQIPHF